MNAPKVAVVGRQNVGKSTLLNRLLGRREAIAHPSSGVTRDRIEVEVTWRGRSFSLVDTGGFVGRASGIDALVTNQAQRAAEEANIVVLVCDATTGVQDEDERLARRLRKTNSPVLLVANKVDSERDEPEAAVFNRLGLGEPLPVSALHGRGSGELLDRIVDLLPEGSSPGADETEPRFAVVGKPNVGKSSLFNRLVKEERSVVFEEAGTTRDAVDAVVVWEGGPVRFVDTAGLRRASRTEGVEYFSLIRTMQAIDRAHVVLLVLDASDGVSQEDKRIASEVVQAGRALLVAANKWDLVEDRAKLFDDLQETFALFAAAPVLRVSALTEAGLKRLPQGLLGLQERWHRRVPTARVNELLQQAQAEHPAPRGSGKYHYATQVGTGPPAFVVFGGKAPDAGYGRFLESRLRRAFDLVGVPIRVKFHAGRRRAR